MCIQGTLAALRYARMLSDDITAVHISMEPQDTEKVRKKWEIWGRGTRLVIVDSPYRLFLEPLLDYIDEILSSRQANETITIVVPHFVPDNESITPFTCRLPKCCAANCFPHRAWSSQKSLIRFLRHDSNFHEFGL